MKGAPTRAAVAVALAVGAHLSIARVARADEPPPPTASAPAPNGWVPAAPYPTAAAPYPAAAPPSPAPGWPPALAVLRADNPRARLQVQTWAGWQDVCPTPCGVAVDAAALYRITGPAIVTSDPFRLPGPSGTVTIDAKTGSKAKRWVGLGMLVGGAGAALLGTVFYEASSNLGPDINGSYTTRDADRVYSAGVVLTGVAVSIVGVVLLQSRTVVDVR